MIVLQQRNRPPLLQGDGRTFRHLSLEQFEAMKRDQIEASREWDKERRRK